MLFGRLMKVLRIKEYEVLLDDDVYETVAQYKWRASRRVGGYTYFMGGPGYQQYLHRFITKAAPGELVDHINHNQLDNRKVNLRVCTRRENARNQRIRSNNTTGYKGVSQIKKRGSFMAYIWINNKEQYLGTYDTAIEAARSYDEAATKHFGEFAYINEV